MEKEPKTYKIPSKDWGVTANEAAEILISAEEIKSKPKLLDAARKVINQKLAATKKVAKKI